MHDELSAEVLFERVWNLAPSRNPEAALRLGAEQWEAMRGRSMCDHDAETCRLLALATLESDLAPMTTMLVWRTRALARYTAVGWTEGVAAVMMGDAFRALAIANDEYAAGMTLDVIRGDEDAIRVIEEIEAFSCGEGSGHAVGQSSPSPALVRRWLYEKRGFLRLVARDFDEARADYDLAAVHNEGRPRGVIKVLLGRLLVDYLEEIESETGDGSRWVEMTAAALEDVDLAKDVDVYRTAAANLVVMRRGGRDLTPYEYL